MQIGFIGQGFVGKNIANDFEQRGHSVVRYALEPEYVANRGRVSECEIVFIAVPTPTTPSGFDFSIVKEAMALVGEGKIAVIKSTLLPKTTREIQDTYQGKVVLFAPEFLCEATAAYDAAHPMFNIIGIPYESAGYRKAAEMLAELLPHSEHTFIVPAHAAELFKYVHNVHGFMRVIMANMFHDLAESLEVDWADVKAIMDTDPMMSPYYNAPVHKGGRGAGGNCFIKDMAAFRRLFEIKLPEDSRSITLLKMFEEKNLELLAASGKSQDIVKNVYGSTAILPAPRNTEQ